MTLAFQLRWRRFKSDLSQLASNARDQWAEREGIIVALSDEDGITGFGEASPLPGYSPDAIDTVVQELQAFDVANLEEASNLQDLFLRLQDLSAPSLRFALETAWIDAGAKHLNASMANLLCGTPARDLEFCALVDVADVTTWLERTQELWERGSRTLKFKIGRDIDAELAALLQIRGAFPGLKLRVDANQSIAERDWGGIAAHLSELDLEFVEEPCPDLAYWRDAPPGLKLAADESLRRMTLEQVHLALKSRLVHVLILKPTTLGGIFPCLELANLAQAANASAVISHCYEGAIAYAALTHVSLALPSAFAHGLGVHPGLDSYASSPVLPTPGSTMVGLGVQTEVL